MMFVNKCEFVMGEIQMLCLNINKNPYLDVLPIILDKNRPADCAVQLKYALKDAIPYSEILKDNNIGPYIKVNHPHPVQ